MRCVATAISELFLAGQLAELGKIGIQFARAYRERSQVNDEREGIIIHELLRQLVLLEPESKFLELLLTFAEYSEASALREKILAIENTADINSEEQTQVKLAFDTFVNWFENHNNNEEFLNFAHENAELQAAYEAYHALGQQTESIEFWENSLVNKALLISYANFFRKRSTYLLPCEVAIIAHVKNLHVVLDGESYNKAGSQTVRIAFNGTNHYERCEIKAQSTNATPSTSHVKRQTLYQNTTSNSQDQNYTALSETDITTDHLATSTSEARNLHVEEKDPPPNPDESYFSWWKTTEYNIKTVRRLASDNKLGQCIIKLKDYKKIVEKGYNLGFWTWLGDRLANQKLFNERLKIKTGGGNLEILLPEQSLQTLCYEIENGQGKRIEQIFNETAKKNTLIEAFSHLIEIDSPIRLDAVIALCYLPDEDKEPREEAISILLAGLLGPFDLEEYFDNRYDLMHRKTSRLGGNFYIRRRILLALTAAVNKGQTLPDELLSFIVDQLKASNNIEFKIKAFSNNTLTISHDIIEKATGKKDVDALKAIFTAIIHDQENFSDQVDAIDHIKRALIETSHHSAVSLYQALILCCCDPLEEEICLERAKAAIEFALWNIEEGLTKDEVLTINQIIIALSIRLIRVNADPLFNAIMQKILAPNRQAAIILLHTISCKRGLHALPIQEIKRLLKLANNLDTNSNDQHCNELIESLQYHLNKTDEYLKNYHDKLKKLRSNNRVQQRKALHSFLSYSEDGLLSNEEALPALLNVFQQLPEETDDYILKKFIELLTQITFNQNDKASLESTIEPITNKCCGLHDNEEFLLPLCDIYRAILKKSNEHNLHDAGLITQIIAPFIYTRLIEAYHSEDPDPELQKKTTEGAVHALQAHYYPNRPADAFLNALDAEDNSTLSECQITLMAALGAEEIQLPILPNATLEHIVTIALNSETPSMIAKKALFYYADQHAADIQPNIAESLLTGFKTTNDAGDVVYDGQLLDIFSKLCTNPACGECISSQLLDELTLCGYTDISNAITQTLISYANQHTVSSDFYQKAAHECYPGNAKIDCFLSLIETILTNKNNDFIQKMPDINQSIIETLLNYCLTRLSNYEHLEKSFSIVCEFVELGEDIPPAFLARCIDIINQTDSELASGTLGTISCLLELNSNLFSPNVLKNFINKLESSFNHEALHGLIINLLHQVKGTIKISDEIKEQLIFILLNSKEETVRKSVFDLSIFDESTDVYQSETLAKEITEANNIEDFITDFEKHLSNSKRLTKNLKDAIENHLLTHNPNENQIIFDVLNLICKYNYTVSIQFLHKFIEKFATTNEKDLLAWLARHSRLQTDIDDATLQLIDNTFLNSKLDLDLLEDYLTFFLQMKDQLNSESCDKILSFINANTQNEIENNPNFVETLFRCLSIQSDYLLLLAQPNNTGLKNRLICCTRLLQNQPCLTSNTQAYIENLLFQLDALSEVEKNKRQINQSIQEENNNQTPSLHNIISILNNLVTLNVSREEKLPCVIACIKILIQCMNTCLNEQQLNSNSLIELNDLLTNKLRIDESSHEASILDTDTKRKLYRSIEQLFTLKNDLNTKLIISETLMIFMSQEDAAEIVSYHKILKRASDFKENTNDNHTFNCLIKSTETHLKLGSGIDYDIVIDLLLKHLGRLPEHNQAGCLSIFYHYVQNTKYIPANLLQTIIHYIVGIESKHSHAIHTLELIIGIHPEIIMTLDNTELENYLAYRKEESLRQKLLDLTSTPNISIPREELFYGEERLPYLKREIELTEELFFEVITLQIKGYTLFSADIKGKLYEHISKLYELFSNNNDDYITLNQFMEAICESLKNISLSDYQYGLFFQYLFTSPKKALSQLLSSKQDAENAINIVMRLWIKHHLQQFIHPNCQPVNLSYWADRLEAIMNKKILSLSTLDIFFHTLRIEEPIDDIIQFIDEYVGIEADDNPFLTALDYLHEQNTEQIPLCFIKTQLALKRVLQKNSYIKNVSEAPYLANNIRELIELGWSERKLQTLLDTLANHMWPPADIKPIFKLLNNYQATPDVFDAVRQIIIDAKPHKVMRSVANHLQTLNFLNTPTRKTPTQLIEEFHTANPNVTFPNLNTLIGNKELTCKGNYFSENLAKNTAIQQWSKKDLQKWSKKIAENSKGSENPSTLTTEQLPEIIAVLNRALYLHTQTQRTVPYEFRWTQILSIITLLHSNDDINQRQFLQVDTGEGKSFIFAAMGVLLTLLGNRVAILTSHETDAKQKANELNDFYQLFGLTALTNFSLNETADKKSCYKNKNAVVYSTFAELAFDHLHFVINNDVLPINTGLLDELDNGIVDNHKNHAKLSEPMPNMDHLNDLFVYIFIQFCALLREQNELLLSDITQFKKTLLTSLERKLAPALKSNIPIFDKDKKLDDELPYIPNDLREYVKNTLPLFVDNILMAFSMKKDHQYVDGDNDQSEIRIVDQTNTGEIQDLAHWEDGLHQFVELFDHAKVTTPSLTTNFTSNHRLVTGFPLLSGLTGTLGGEAEETLYRELYHANTVRIPRFQIKQQIHYPPLIIDQVTTHVDDSQLQTNWRDAISEATALETKLGRATLIFFESIEEVNSFETHLLQYLKNRDLTHFHIKKCRRNDTNEIAVLKNKLQPGDIILSTNLLGRGADPICDNRCLHNAGLHVIVTFLPDNERVYQQAIGRSARNGEPGSCQLIVPSLHLNKQSFKQYLEEKDKASALEFEKYLKTDYLIDTMEEDFFKAFCNLKNTLATKNAFIAIDIRETAYINSLIQKYKKLSLEFHWALFLNTIKMERYKTKLDKDSALTFRKKSVHDFENFLEKMETLWDTDEINISGYNTLLANELIAYRETKKSTVASLGRYTDEFIQTTLNTLNRAIECDCLLSHHPLSLRAFTQLHYQNKDKDTVVSDALSDFQLALELTRLHLHYLLKRKEYAFGCENASLSAFYQAKIDTYQLKENSLKVAIQAIYESQKRLNLLINDEIYPNVEREEAIRLLEDKGDDQAVHATTIQFNFLRFEKDFFIKIRNDAKKVIEASPEDAQFSITYPDITRTNANEIIEQILDSNDALRRELIQNPTTIRIMLNAIKLNQQEALLETLPDHIQGNLTLTLFDAKFKKELKSTSNPFDGKAKINELLEIDPSLSDEKIPITLRFEFYFTAQALPELINQLPLFVDRVALTLQQLNKKQTTQITEALQTDIKAGILSVHNLQKESAIQLLGECKLKKESITAKLEPIESAVRFMPQDQIQQIKSSGLNYFIKINEKPPIRVGTTAILIITGAAHVGVAIAMAVGSGGVLTPWAACIAIDGVGDWVDAARVARGHSFSWKIYFAAKGTSLSIGLISAGTSGLFTATSKQVLAEGAEIAVKQILKDFLLKCGECAATRGVTTTFTKTICYSSDFIVHRAEKQISQSAEMTIDRFINAFITANTKRLKLLFSIGRADANSQNDLFPSILFDEIADIVNNLGTVSSLSEGGIPEYIKNLSSMTPTNSITHYCTERFSREFNQFLDKKYRESNCQNIIERLTNNNAEYLIEQLKAFNLLTESGDINLSSSNVEPPDELLDSIENKNVRTFLEQVFETQDTVYEEKIIALKHVIKQLLHNAIMQLETKKLGYLKSAFDTVLTVASVSAAHRAGLSHLGNDAFLIDIGHNLCGTDSHFIKQLLTSNGIAYAANIFSRHTYKKIRKILIQRRRIQLNLPDHTLASTLKQINPNPSDNHRTFIHCDLHPTLSKNLYRYVNELIPALLEAIEKIDLNRNPTPTPVSLVKGIILSNPTMLAHQAIYLKDIPPEQLIQFFSDNQLQLFFNSLTLEKEHLALLYRYVISLVRPRINNEPQNQHLLWGQLFLRNGLLSPDTIKKILTHLSSINNITILEKLIDKPGDFLPALDMVDDTFIAILEDIRPSLETVLQPNNDFYALYNIMVKTFFKHVKQDPTIKRAILSAHITKLIRHFIEFLLPNFFNQGMDSLESLPAVIEKLKINTLSNSYINEKIAVLLDMLMNLPSLKDLTLKLMGKNLKNLLDFVKSFYENPNDFEQLIHLWLTFFNSTYHSSDPDDPDHQNFIQFTIELLTLTERHSPEQFNMLWKSLYDFGCVRTKYYDEKEFKFLAGFLFYLLSSQHDSINIETLYQDYMNGDFTQLLINFLKLIKYSPSFIDYLQNNHLEFYYFIQHCFWMMTNPVLIYNSLTDFEWLSAVLLRANALDSLVTTVYEEKPKTLSTKAIDRLILILEGFQSGDYSWSMILSQGLPIIPLRISSIFSLNKNNYFQRILSQYCDTLPEDQDQRDTENTPINLIDDLIEKIDKNHIRFSDDDSSHNLTKDNTLFQIRAMKLFAFQDIHSQKEGPLVFQRMIMEKINFMGSTFNCVAFKNVTFTCCRFNFCRFTDVQFKNCRFDKTTFLSLRLQFNGNPSAFQDCALDGDFSDITLSMLDLILFDLSSITALENTTIDQTHTFTKNQINSLSKLGSRKLEFKKNTVFSYPIAALQLTARYINSLGSVNTMPCYSIDKLFNEIITMLEHIDADTFIENPDFQTALVSLFQEHTQCIHFSWYFFTSPETVFIAESSTGIFSEKLLELLEQSITKNEIAQGFY